MYLVARGFPAYFTPVLVLYIVAFGPMEYKLFIPNMVSERARSSVRATRATRDSFDNLKGKL
jgi:hypothetical protein